MEIITQIFFEKITQYFLNEWRAETMVALICFIVFAFILNVQKTNYEKQLKTKNEIITEYSNILNENNQNIKKILNKINIIIERNRQEEIINSINDLKNYVSNLLK